MGYAENSGTLGGVKSVQGYEPERWRRYEEVID